MSLKTRLSLKIRKADVVGWIGPSLFLVCVGLLGTLRGAYLPGDLDWQNDLPIAQRLARRTHRPLLLVFYTQGCPWCAKMDVETFTDPRVVELSRHFVCVRVDGEMMPALRDQYRVLGYPTTVFLDVSDNDQGNILGKLPDYVPPYRFQAALRKILHMPISP